MSPEMKRRKFVTLIGGAAAAWPLAARAQQTKLPTIGFLIAGTSASHGAWFAALVQRLRELGWIEGRTVAIEYRWAGARNEQYADIAAELVKLKVDVIVTHGVALLAAKQVTSVIPIVFPVSGDPGGLRPTASVARPPARGIGRKAPRRVPAGCRHVTASTLIPDRP